MGHQRFQVGVVGVGLEAESVLQGDGEGDDEVECRELGEEVGFAGLGVLVVSLFGVDPDMAGQVTGRLAQLSPILAPLDIPLVGAGGAERNSQTHHETQHGEQETRDHEGLHELGDAGDQGGPATNED